MQMRPGRAHNDYLNLLADWGTVGGVVVLAGLAAFGAGLIKTWKYVRPPENDFSRGLGNRAAFFLGAFAGLLALAVHSLVDFNLHIPANALLGVTWLALLGSSLRFAPERHWLTARFPVKTLVTLALVAGVGYLGCKFFIRPYRSLDKGVCRRANEFRNGLRHRRRISHAKFQGRTKL
jgi:hypothetical protein